MAIVYKHIRVDKNEVFYIGIGKTEKRAFEKKSRNFYWRNIAKFGYNVEILYNDLSWEKACEKEIELIKIYGRNDLNKGTLCNMTDGGDGVLGLTHLKESKEKIGAANKGNQYLLNFKHSEESKRKMRVARKDKPLSEITKERMSISRTGLNFSEERKLNISLGKMKNNPACGENLPFSKLIENEIIQIRELKGQLTTRKIGEIFNISHQNVSSIQNNQTWKHVKTLAVV